MRPPQSWSSARMTLGIAGLTFLAWLIGTTIVDLDFLAIWGGFIPSRVNGMVGDEGLAPVWLTPITATLVHAGFVHLVFNLLILLFCGRAVETVVGSAGLGIIYIVGAYVSAGAHYLVDPNEAFPMIGASGAISAVLGAYAMLFGRNRVKIKNDRLALLVNALWLGVAWVILQIVAGYTFQQTFDARIAIAAHIGGFLAGLVLGRPLLLWRYRKA